MKNTPKNVAERLQITEEKAAEVIALMEGSADPETYRSVQRWVGQCYHKPSHSEMVMCALDEILETYGVEALRREGRCDPYYGDCIASYCNNGHTYATTIIRDHYRERYSITSVGSFLRA